MEYYSIEQIAELKHVSLQAVYKQINGKALKERLQGHRKKIEGKTYIDEEGLAIILESTKESPVVYVEDKNVVRVRELEDELKILQEKYDQKDQAFTSLTGTITDLLQQVQKLNEMQLESRKMLEEKAQAEQKLNEMQLEKQKMENKQVESEQKLNEMQLQNQNLTEENAALNNRIEQLKGRSFWQRLRNKD